LKKRITLFIIVLSTFYITLFTACTSKPPPRPVAKPPLRAPQPQRPPRPVNAHPPAISEQLTESVALTVQPEEPQPIEQVALAPDEQEEPPEEPEEPQPIEQIALAPDEQEEPLDEQEEPQPIEQVVLAPDEPQPDMSLPEISVDLLPLPYCPINPDGEEQLLTANIHVKSASPIDTWYIELRAPDSDGVFMSFAQKGKLPETLTWNGRNRENELVESATLYNYSLTAANAYGSTTYQGTLAIDVVVRREGRNRLRMIVPSIIFPPNSAQLTRGLDPATRENNDKILKRIAEILNNFETYKVRVEGHANPTFAPNSRQRATEERGTKRILGLQPLSERRAKAVVEYLIKLGIARSRLTPIGMGGRMVRVEFADKPNWWKNRRVEFLLEKP